MIGEALLYQSLYDWSRHIGEMRMIVARNFQRKGLGSLLAREIFLQGIRLKYKIITLYLLEEDRAAQACVEKLGFKKEALMKGYARDINDVQHNMVLMTFNVEEMWQNLQDFSQNYEIHSER